MADEGLPFDEVLPRIAALAEQLTSHADRAVAAAAEELLDWVDAFHREGLGELVEMIRAWRGEIFLDAAAGHPVVGRLLAAYGLGDDPAVAAEAHEAVTAALEEIRPYAESHGGTILLDDIVDGVVKVQMVGSCDGCPAAGVTLSQGVEQALRDRWPGFRRLEVAGEDAEPADADVGAPEPQPLLHIRGHEGA